MTAACANQRTQQWPGAPATVVIGRLLAAQSCEELPDVAGHLVRDLERGEVAALLELAPVHDVAVVALGQRPDRLEVVGEDRDPGWRRIDRRLGTSVRLLVVVTPSRR